jgi:hypothetical protein
MLLPLLPALRAGEDDRLRGVDEIGVVGADQLMALERAVPQLQTQPLRHIEHVGIDAARRPVDVDPGVIRPRRAERHDRRAVANVRRRDVCGCLEPL